MQAPEVFYVDDSVVTARLLEKIWPGIMVKEDITHIMRRYFRELTHGHCYIGKLHSIRSCPLLLPCSAQLIKVKSYHSFKALCLYACSCFLVVSGVFMSELRDAVFIFDPEKRKAIMERFNLTEEAAAAKGHKWMAARWVYHPCPLSLSLSQLGNVHWYKSCLLVEIPSYSAGTSYTCLIITFWCRCPRILLAAALMEVNLEALYSKFVIVVDGNGVPLFKDTMLGTHQHQQELVRQKRVEGVNSLM